MSPETNLRIAFPDAAEAEIARLLDAQWDQLGRWAAEFPILDRIIADPGRVEVVGAERLAAIRDGAGPVVFISGHFSSFEIMPAVIIHAGDQLLDHLPGHQQPLRRRSASARAARATACGCSRPRARRGARDLLRALGARRIRRPDERPEVQRRRGRAASSASWRHTAPGPLQLRPALRHAAAADERAARAARRAFRVVVHEPIRLEDTGDRDADIEAGVRRINAFIEERVRERPDRMVLGPQALAERGLQDSR